MTFPNKARVAFFDLERALLYGYVMEPRLPTSSFGDPQEKASCSVYYQSIREGRYDTAKPCTTRCAMCDHVAKQNDYMRGFVQVNGKRELAPAHYPVPATFLDCITNHEQWRVQQYLNGK